MPSSRFIEDGKLLLGICNGFQVLVKMGLLPGNGSSAGSAWKQDATLTRNNSGRFEDRWVHLTVRNDHRSVFLKGVESLVPPDPSR